MSKFKTGDRVRKIGSSFLREFPMGAELVVVGKTVRGFMKVAEETDLNEWGVSADSDIELIQSAETETITLIRYIKPATIEINGVEYLLPEKKNAA